MSKPFTSVWAREPRRPRSSGLGREQIVAAAVDMLDTEGLGALSMRKLGARLGAGATSLYWYVANKDELLELAMDEVWGMVEVPDPDRTPWREVATTTAYGLRVTLLAHPWMANLFGRMPSVGPHAFALSDRLRRAFVRAGFTGIDVYLANGTLMGFVLGQVIPEIGVRQATAGGTYDTDSMVAVLERTAADYPQMRADFRETVQIDPEAARAMAFDFALLCVLDGLEARLAAARTQGTPERTAQTVARERE
ncbi:TetR/AcrR family transcriptional regulator [Nocardia vaccinii]|uniref:TetR/AcrR family transcriptional regulator n=1 Tax=Nocardia vaccinii TaxID=1822 RepID=UPI00082CAB41|nr:TetR/AcrR family transcriptional regulator [Nocardia vaccinii]